MLRRMDILVAAALAAAACLAGCGNETTSPVAPADTVPPAAVTGLTLHASAAAVQLTWNPGPEPDLVGYRVYRNQVGARSGPPKRDSAHITMELVHEVTHPPYVDANVETGSSYRYAVSAVDAAGNESPRAQGAVAVVAAVRTPENRFE